MIEQLFDTLALIDDFLWVYIGIPLVMLVGLYLTVKTKAVQVRFFPHVVRKFLGLCHAEKDQKTGVHPLKAFFASIGGCMGMANVVIVCNAVKFGGPGALLWLWIAALFGMLLKYAEVWLGVKYRVKNDHGGYDGGPLLYLEKVFSKKWIPVVVCFLLCLYGVEILQFNLIVTTFSEEWGWSIPITAVGLLALVVYAASGGVARVGEICAAIIPLFIAIYMVMGCWVLIQHASLLPAALKLVVTSAFTGHAAVGGFGGAGVIMALSHGLRRACYSGDVGIGYAAVIHSESSTTKPEEQASLAIFEIFLDTFVVCTMTLLLIIVTGVWSEPISDRMMITQALETSFPYAKLFMPFFTFLLGYSTIISFFCFGLKCSEEMDPKIGPKIYYIYACGSLLFFSFVKSDYALTIMSIVGACLVAVNVYGIFKLRNKIDFDFWRS